MEREQYQQVAIVAGALAVIVALMSGRLPRWLRIVLVLSLGILAAGAGLFGYRYITQPTTLTIAAGSLDGDVPRIMSAMAQRMASTNAPIRRSEEHTSELQSLRHLVCRLLLEIN